MCVPRFWEDGELAEVMVDMCGVWSMRTRGGVGLAHLDYPGLSAMRGPSPGFVSTLFHEWVHPGTEGQSSGMDAPSNLPGIDPILHSLPWGGFVLLLIPSGI